MTEKVKVIDKVTALIDADVLIYRVGFGSQTTFYKVVSEDGQEMGPYTRKREANDACEFFMEADLEHEIVSKTVAIDEEDAKKNMDNTIAEIMQGSESDICIPILSGAGNFRKEVATIQPYKGNRSGSRPLHYDMLREYIMEEYDNAIMTDGIEADDELSIQLFEAFTKSNGKKEDCLAICCSIDKDLKNTPGWHYNIVKREFDWVTNDKADYNFWYQMLVGDSCDNIPGVSKVRKLNGLRGGLVGEKTAIKILDESITDNVEGYFEVVRRKYLDIFTDPAFIVPSEDFDPEEQTDKVMTEIGALLWMQRYEGEEYSLPVFE